MKKAFLKALYLFLTAILLAGCNVFSSETMTDVFSRSVEKMEVVRMDLVGDMNLYESEADRRNNTRGEYAVDKEGVLCIPSNTEYTVDYIIKNPQGFEFNAEVTNASDGIEVLQYVTEPYTYSVTEDYTRVRVNLSSEMLTKMEKGGTITPLVQILCPEYGNTIPLYYVDLRSNSRPPLVQCAVPMVNTEYRKELTNTSASSLGKYVLCFNLPDILFDSNPSKVRDGIHSDVIRIRIEGLEGKTSGEQTLASRNGVELNLAWNTGLSKWTYNELLPAGTLNTLSVNTYYNIGVSRTSGMPAPTFYPGNHPVYVYDNRQAHIDDVNPDSDYEYKITLIDQMGLEQTLSVTTSSKQLCPVTINGGYGEKLTTDERNNVYIRTNDVKDGIFDLVLDAPKRTLGTAFDFVEDAEVVYTIYGSENSSNLTYLTSGSQKEMFKYTMETGWSYKVYAYAHKIGYIDSYVSEWNIHVGMEDVQVEVMYKPIQYYVDFALSPTPISFMEEDSGDYKINVTMKVYDIDKAGEIAERYGGIVNESQRIAAIQNALNEEAIVTSGYALSDFEMYIMDIDTRWNEDIVETLDTSKLSSQVVSFTWPEKYSGVGINDYQVYVKVNITNTSYEEGDKAYKVANSALLKLTVEAPN